MRGKRKSGWGLAALKAAPKEKSAALEGLSEDAMSMGIMAGAGGVSLLLGQMVDGKVATLGADETSVIRNPFLRGGILIVGGVVLGITAGRYVHAGVGAGVGVGLAGLGLAKVVAAALPEPVRAKLPGLGRSLLNPAPLSRQLSAAQANGQMGATVATEISPRVARPFAPMALAGLQVSEHGAGGPSLFGTPFAATLIQQMTPEQLATLS